MDIAAMSVVVNQAQVKQQASLSVMKSVVSIAEENGEALIKMMEKTEIPNVRHPNLGGKIDLKG